MAKDTYYFSHDFNSRHDPKMITLQMEYQMEGIGIFWCLVEMLHEQGGYIRTEYERIAYELRTDSNKVKWIIEQSGLFKINDDKFYSESALQRILQRDEKSKKAAKSVSYRWSNNERNTNVSETYNDGNTIKERKGNKIKDIPNWKKDFQIYLAECKEAFRQYYTDENFIKTQQALNPNVNVKLSITKGYENFWKTEAGWKHKKKSKTEQIDWKRTIINTIEMNRVYYTKQEIAEINNR